MQEIINIKDVSYSYPNSKIFALKDINLSVNEGEFLAVIGGTGSGKSTLCRLFNGIIPHSLGGRLLGNIIVDGEAASMSSVPELAKKVGMVFDDPDAQIFTSSVLAEAAFALENFCLPPQEIKEKVKNALGAVGLAGFEERQPSTLSGGEKQRLAIACALAMAGEGKILVLDEPLVKLDPQGAEEVMSIIKDIRQKHQITVIVTFSTGSYIDGFADRVCVLENGRVVDYGKGKNFNTDFHGLARISTDFLKGGGQSPSFPVRENPLNPCKSVVSIKDLTYIYNNSNAGLKNFSLDIYENDFAAIVGRNGCGKTTLLKCITGLFRPQSGDVFIHGRNTKELSVSAISKEVGFVMQNPDTQLFTDSVYKEVSFALKNFGLSKEEINHKVQAALSAVGLDDFDAFPHGLNRADRTKVVIACVLAMDCKIIIFDEVDAALDYSESRHIMNIAKDLHKRGFTIIFVTHNISLAGEYASVWHTIA